MSRYSKKNVEHAVSSLAEALGAPLKLEMHSPGDRLGTRYRVYTHGDTPGSLGRQIFAECGAAAATERLWTAIDILRVYKGMQAPATPATAQLQDIEAQ